MHRETQAAWAIFESATGYQAAKVTEHRLTQ